MREDEGRLRIFFFFSFLLFFACFVCLSLPPTTWVILWTVPRGTTASGVLFQIRVKGMLGQFVRIFILG